MVALSVSISASTSPAETWSPLFFFHATRVPSVIVSLSLGIWISGMVKKLNGYKVTSLQRARFDLVTFVILLTDFTRSRPVSRLRRVFQRSAGQRVPSLHCKAWEHLPVIRVESAHPAHRKCLFEFGSKFLHRPRRTDGP